MTTIKGTVGRLLAPLNNRKALLILLAVCVLFLLLIPLAGHAGLYDKVVRGIIAYIGETLISLLGQLFLMIVSVLVSVAGYNEFVNSAPVMTGWVLVRDLTNMFFVIVLLIIAFGTILGSEKYTYKNKAVSRLLIMAIVVNFSRTICGLLIDLTQVVMLTFVKGFEGAAGGNFIEALKIAKVMEMKEGTVDLSALAVSMLFAVILLLASLMLVLIMVAVLVVRIIYLWLLVILSPIAFFMKTIPSGAAQSYYAEWWRLFTQQAVVGPVMAFFLWLALVSVAAPGGLVSAPSGAESSEGTLSKVFNAGQIQEFIIAFALLYGGVMMAQRMSPQGVGLAKRAKGMAKGGAKFLGGQAMKRTGMSNYLAQRRQAREQKYAKRGQLIGVGAGMMGAGFKDRLGKMLGGARGLDSESGRLKRGLEMGKLETARGLALEDSSRFKTEFEDAKTDKGREKAKKKWDKAETKAGELGRQIDTMELGEEIGEGMPQTLRQKMLGGVGRRLQASAEKDAFEASKTDHQLVMKEKEQVAAQTRDETLGKAREEIPSDPGMLLEGKARSLQANMLHATENNLFDASEINGMKERWGATNPGKMSNNAMDKALFDNYKLRSNAPEEFKKKELDAGKGLDLSKASAATVGEHAVEMAQSVAADQYFNRMNPEQLKSANKSLNSVPEGAKDESIRAGILRSAVAEGMQKGYGVSAQGQFSMPEFRRMFIDAMGRKDSGKMMINVDAGLISNGKGGVTDAGMASVEGANNNKNSLSNAAREAATRGDEAGQKVMEAYVDAVMSTGDSPEAAVKNKYASLRKFVKDGRQFRSYLGRHGTESKGAGSAPSGGGGDSEPSGGGGGSAPSGGGGDSEPSGGGGGEKKKLKVTDKRSGKPSGSGASLVQVRRKLDAAKDNYSKRVAGGASEAELKRLRVKLEKLEEEEDKLR